MAQIDKIKEKLDSINKNIADNEKKFLDCDKRLTETEAGYSKVRILYN